MTDITHAFVVPAYGHSPHLRDCLASLAGQIRSSPIIVCTSTAFDGIDALCGEYGARVVRHGPNRGIGPDWNAALASADTDLVTLAHQDDVYLPNFSESLLAAHARSPSSALFFCNAEEMTHSGLPRQRDRNNRIKRWMVFAAFAGRKSITDSLSQRILLGFGNPIVCPAVSLNRDVVPDFRFRENLRTNMDWFAWVELTAFGAVTRIDSALIKHRVHNDSETSRCLDDGARQAEDLMVFERLWPKKVAHFLSRLYSRSYAGYSE
jgi:hypothetical protein